MRIEFELEDKGTVKVIGISGKSVRKQIGTIFTPGGTCKDSLNTIQICGINDAFDYWGCARYHTYKVDKTRMRYAEHPAPKLLDVPPPLLDALKEAIGEEKAQILIDAIYEHNRWAKMGVPEGRVFEQLRDIQLRFPFPTESFEGKELSFDLNQRCPRCYNLECSCDNKIGNPYQLKRASDLFIEKVKKDEPRSDAQIN